MPKVATKPADPITRIEAARRKINQIEVKGEEGARAVRFVREAFDETVEKLVDLPLMSGDPDALASIEANRDRLARVRSRARQSPNEDADAVLTRMTTNDATLGHVASWIVGSTKAQPPTRALARLSLALAT